KRPAFSGGASGNAPSAVPTGVGMTISSIVKHPPMQTSQPPRRPSFVDESELEDHSPSTQSKIAAPVSRFGSERALLVMLSGLNAGQVFALDRDETVMDEAAAPTFGSTTAA